MTRGCWIGGAEYRLARRLLSPRRGDTLLDVGCGTGHFQGLPVADLRVRTAVFLPSGNHFARGAERLLPSFLPWGGLLVVCGRRGSRDG